MSPVRQRGWLAALLGAVLMLPPVTGASQEQVVASPETAPAQDRPTARSSWQAIRTDKVVVLYPGHARIVAEAAAAAAEASIADIERRLGMTWAGRPTWMVLPSSRFLAESQIPIASENPEGALWTRHVRRRRIIVFDGSYAELRRDVTHAAVHEAVARMLNARSSWLRGRLRSHAPDWLTYGLALYFAGEPSAGGELILRGASLGNRLLPLDELTDFSKTDLPLAAMHSYSAVSYVAGTFGEPALGDIVRLLSQRRGIDEALIERIGLDGERLTQRWHRSLKKRYWPLIRSRQTLNSVAVELRPEGAEVVSDPAWSPTGEVIACVARTGRTDEVWLISARDGKRVRSVTSHSANRQSGIDTRGRALAWSPDGDRLAYVVHEASGTFLDVTNAVTKRRTHHLRSPLDDIWSPVFRSDEVVVVAGVRLGQSDLYEIDLTRGQWVRLTDDSAFDSEPALDPASRAQVLYSSEQDGVSRIVRLDLATRRSETLVEGAGVGSPAWAPDGGSFVFTADLDGTRDVYTASSDGPGISQATKLLVPAQEPSFSPDGRRLSFSAQADVGVSIFTLDAGELLREPVERESFAEHMPERHSPMEPQVESARVPSVPELDRFGLLLATEDDGRPRASLRADLSGWTGGVRGYAMVTPVSVGAPDVGLGSLWNRSGIAFSVGAGSHTAFHATGPGRDRASEREWSVVAGAARRLGASTNLSASLGAWRGSLPLSFLGVLGGASPSVVPDVRLALTHDTVAGGGYSEPVSGTHAAIAVNQTVSDVVKTATFTGDLRRYVRLGSRTVLATRWLGQLGTGSTPRSAYLGGNTTLRGSEFEEVVGSRVGHGSVELRVPLLDDVVLGWPVKLGLSSVRAVGFVDAAVAWSPERAFRLSRVIDGERQLDALHIDYGFGLRLHVAQIPVQLDIARQDRMAFVSPWRVRMGIGNDF